MIVIRGFIRYALLSIGWRVEQFPDGTLVATDLHGTRFKITVTHED